MAAFTRGKLTDFDGGFGSSAGLAQRFQGALLTWQHPQAALPGVVISALGASKPGQAVLDARRAAWQEALRALFLTLRASRCSAFYLATAPVRIHPSGSDSCFPCNAM